MTNTKNLILQLKEVKKEKELSLDKIKDMVESTGNSVSKSTLSRVFAEGSEDKQSFSYDFTILPIANALLDVDIEEESDDLDTKAMKSLLKVKMERMRELEREVEQLRNELDREKVKYHEKLEREREHFNNSLEFLKHQVDLKDKRMDLLFEAIFIKNAQHDEILNAVMSCPLRKDED